MNRIDEGEAHVKEPSIQPEQPEDPEDRYREEVLVLVDSFRYELCDSCMQDLSRHAIGPDPLGHAHVYCLTETGE